MEQTINKKDQLNEIYLSALKNHLVTNKSEFAELIGIHRQSLYSATNGDERFLTDSLLHKAQRAHDDALANARANNTMVNQDNAHGNTQHISQDSEMINQVVSKLVDEMARQRESYERIILAALEAKK